MDFSACAAPTVDLDDLELFDAEFYREPPDVCRGVAVVSLGPELALHESSSGAEKPDAILSFGAAPSLPEDFELGCSTLRSSLSASEFGSALLDAVLALPGASVEKTNADKCSMKVQICQGEFGCVLKARIYDGGCGELLVEFQRRSGCACLFQDAFARATAAVGVWP